MRVREYLEGMGKQEWEEKEDQEVSVGEGVRKDEAEGLIGGGGGAGVRR